MFNYYNSERVPRERLYELVWEQPMQKLAAEVGISDVALAKTCRKSGIPLPPRGYWARLQAGKAVARIPLPVRELGDATHVAVSGNIAGVLTRRFGEGACEYQDGPYEDIDAMAARYRKRLGKMAVPRDFSKAHPEIRKLLDKDELHRQKKLTERWYYHEPVFDTPFERRRLRIINALFIAASRTGGKCWMNDQSAREFGITIGDQQISLKLDKPQSAGARRGSTKAGTTDQLRLAISYHEPPGGIVMAWMDEAETTIEKRFADIFIEIAIAAEQLHRGWVRRQIQWALERKAAAEEKERQRLAEIERQRQEHIAAFAKARLDSLHADAAALQQAANIRAYVARVRDDLVASAPAGRLETWSAWALAEADRLDPIVSGRAFETLERLEQEEEGGEGSEKAHTTE